MKLDDGIDKEEEKEIKDVANSYARYGSLGIQMVDFQIRRSGVSRVPYLP